MDRQTLSPEAEAFIAERRAHHRAEADAGIDDDLDEKDRRNRADVLGPSCRVKEDDDVLLGETAYRVIGPARGEGWVCLAMEGMRGLTDAPFDGAGITDRAPADPNDEPLPIFVEPEAEPEQ